MKIIMISGKSGHGKDTIATMMKKELEEKNKKVLLLHFADPVKWFAKEIYNWDGNKDVAGRNLLQYIGTTLMRSYNKYYWGNMISEFIAANDKENKFDYAIIPDWRFNSELASIRTFNSHIVTVRIERLDAKGFPYINPIMTKEQSQHISETELDRYPFKYTIYNDGNLDKLHKAAIKILTDIDRNGEKE